MICPRRKTSVFRHLDITTSVQNIQRSTVASITNWEPNYRAYFKKDMVRQLQGHCGKPGRGEKSCFFIEQGKH